MKNKILQFVDVTGDIKNFEGLPLSGLFDNPDNIQIIAGFEYEGNFFLAYLKDDVTDTNVGDTNR
jgi:hypothetical protein